MLESALGKVHPVAGVLMGWGGVTWEEKGGHGAESGDQVAVLLHALCAPCPLKSPGIEQ